MLDPLRRHVMQAGVMRLRLDRLRLDRLRLRWLKIGGGVHVSLVSLRYRYRYRLHLASSHPGQPLWGLLAARFNPRE